MNDFMEIEYGFDCLQAAYKGAHGEKLKGVLESCFPGLTLEIENQFNQWLPTIRADSYLVCVSQHLPEEDRTGRLSMWRAYGGVTGVALVLDGGVMVRPSDALGAYSSPVFYGDSPAFASAFGEMVAGLEENAEYLKSLGRERVQASLFSVFRYAVLCTKHPGFREEKEWRVIASPTMYPSARLSKEVVVVRGVPQMVVKLPLVDVPSEGLVGLAIPELLERVIIGPCQFPLVTFLAFARLLSELGVSDPGDRIIISDIPIRHPG